MGGNTKESNDLIDGVPSRGTRTQKRNTNGDEARALTKVRDVTEFTTKAGSNED